MNINIQLLTGYTNLYYNSNDYYPIIFHELIILDKYCHINNLKFVIHNWYNDEYYFYELNDNYLVCNNVIYARKYIDKYIFSINDRYGKIIDTSSFFSSISFDNLKNIRYECINGCCLYNTNINSRQCSFDNINIPLDIKYFCKGNYIRYIKKLDNNRIDIKSSVYHHGICLEYNVDDNTIKYEIISVNCVPRGCCYLNGLDSININRFFIKKNINTNTNTNTNNINININTNNINTNNINKNKSSLIDKLYMWIFK